MEREDNAALGCAARYPCWVMGMKVQNIYSEALVGGVWVP